MPSLLVIDDDPAIHAAVEMTLNMPCQLYLACGAPQALQFLRSSGVDVILLDLKLPGMNGWETLKEIRRMGCYTPVIMMSAAWLPHELPPQRDDVLGFLSKPWDCDDLRGLISRAIMLPMAAA